MQHNKTKAYLNINAPFPLYYNIPKEDIADPYEATNIISPYDFAIEVLHQSNTDGGLLGRDNETKQIDNFARKCIKDKIGGGMYISGVPGSGKSATVTMLMKDWVKLCGVCLF